MIAITNVMLPYLQNWAISEVQTTSKSPFIKCYFYNREIQHIFNNINASYERDTRNTCKHSYFPTEWYDFEL